MVHRLTNDYRHRTDTEKAPLDYRHSNTPYTVYTVGQPTAMLTPYTVGQTDSSWSIRAVRAVQACLEACATPYVAIRRRGRTLSGTERRRTLLVRY